MTDPILFKLFIESIRQTDGEPTEPPVIIAIDERGVQWEIPIGMCEALAIQNALDEVAVSRPLTHDLLLTLTEQLDVPVARVIIDDFSNDTYYARIILNKPDSEVSLDCRPSDGIALALRAHADIFIAGTLTTPNV